MRKIPKPKFQITNSQINFRETVSCLLSPFLSLSFFFGLGRLNRQVRQEPVNEKNPKSQTPNPKFKIQNFKSQIARPISAKLPPASFLLSPVSCLLPPASCLLPPASFLLSPFLSLSLKEYFYWKK